MVSWTIVWSLRGMPIMFRNAMEFKMENVKGSLKFNLLSRVNRTQEAYIGTRSKVDINEAVTNKHHRMDVANLERLISDSSHDLLCLPRHA